MINHKKIRQLHFHNERNFRHNKTLEIARIVKQRVEYIKESLRGSFFRAEVVKTILGFRKF